MAAAPSVNVKLSLPRLAIVGTSLTAATLTVLVTALLRLFALEPSLTCQVMVRADADALLRADAQAVCDKVVALFPRTPLTDPQLGAITSLAYNIGVGEVGGGPDFADSSVRRKLIAGDIKGAADAFRLWRFAGGRELPGLVARRDAERAVFLGQAA